MANMAILGGLGFVFWIIAARLFTPEQVGIGSALVSLINLIAGLSLLGLNIGIIKYLPTAERKNDKINTVLIVTSMTAFLVSTIFILGLSIFSPKLIFLKINIYFAFFFIFSMVILTASICFDSIFVAYRSTKYALIKGIIFSVTKIILLFLLIGYGAMGIFGSWTIAAIFGILVAIMFLITKFDFKISFQYDVSILRKIFKFSFINYLAGLISSLPIFLLPLIIANNLGLESAAHYYIAMTIASILFMVPTATTQSLFAEGSHNEKLMKKHIGKSIKIVAYIVIPLMILTYLFGDYILLIFGKNYSIEGYRFLQLLAISGIFVSINAVYGAIFRIEDKVKELMIISTIGTAITFILTYLLLNKGLFGIGIAWMVGQIVISLLYTIIYAIFGKK
jgi:O-antigen/teichoic acid export membrane protein